LKLFVTYITYSLITFLIILSFFGCSPEKQHDNLSYFFDGVPDPNADKTDPDSLKKKVINDAKNQVVSDETYIHPPYKDECKMCHASGFSNKLLEKQPELCYICHEDMSKKFAYLHGPVASGFCTECHSPHTSKYKKLLVREGQNLCYFCHKKKDVLKNEAHASIEETKCWECHNPHGGSDRTIMN